MFRTKLMVSSLLAVSVLSSQAALAASMKASPLRVEVRIPAPAGARMVRLYIANATTEKLQLKIGETPLTIDPGATVNVIAAEGSKIVNVEATATHAAGVVFSQVTKSLSGATLRIG
jgi:hypothetical protein